MATLCSQWGSSMGRKRKLVYGVGINDAAYSTRLHVNGKETYCPYFVQWKNMLQRCFCNAFLERNPAYANCRVIMSWLRFTTFQAWMEKQDWVGKALDKDLLGDGSLYSPTTCVFVPRAVNNFVVKGGYAKSLPIGVSWSKSACKYEAYISTGNKKFNLGLYASPEEAHEAWRIAKKSQCLELINQQTCPRTKRGLQKYMRSI